jgi:hypothetical protein
MSSLDSFELIFIFVGCGVVAGCCGTYMLYFCIKSCSVEIPKERNELPLHSNPLFQNKHTTNEDPLPP